ncbi:MAG: hypothetical protein LBB90_11245 [Tannerella sp.]|jgi:hypothetical protein|nr:hypothetical protein [Tannerella sp.]
MTKRILLSAILLAMLPAHIFSRGASAKVEEEPSRVDFSYAFSTPHRVTAGMPVASDRTLLDLQPGSLKISWTYDNLRHYPLATFLTPRTEFSVEIKPHVDGHPFEKSRWTRPKGYLPGVINTYEDSGVILTLSALGAEDAMPVRIEMINNGTAERSVVIRFDGGGMGGMENKGWVDPEIWDSGMLLAGFKNYADRITLIGIGAEKYSETPDGRPHELGKMVMCWTLKPGEKKSAWAVRPYNRREKDAEELRKHDWNTDWDAAEKTWQSLLFDKTVQYRIPDEGVLNGFLASFADLFIMREPLDQGYIGSVPGTEGYRAVNAVEAAIVAVALDQQGLHQDAFDGYRVSYECQGDNGDWNDPSGWGHLMWCGAGVKSWAAIEHYRLTQDRKFLEWIYPRMLASARWLEKMRAYSRKPYEGEKPLNYGLMPRGMGDGGLMNEKDYYGIFLPHNIWSVYSSLIAAEVAQILGKTTEYQELKGYFDTAYSDLLETIRKGSIKEDNYSWIPGVAGKTSGSRWGVLNVTFPCKLLSEHDELVEGTLKHIEKQLSPGGIPVHTGWMVDGMWVAITLDNIAETYLVRRNGDIAAKYFYATLNHATPLYTWCEERGQEANTKQCSGDRQHLWTPVAVVRAFRDMMVFEDHPAIGDISSRSSLQLALGTDRNWLGSGYEVGVEKAPTRFGTVSYSMKYNASNETVSGFIRFTDDKKCPKPEELVLNIRLPGGRKAIAVQNHPDATIAPDGEAVIWKKPKEKTFNFIIKTTL